MMRLGAIAIAAAAGVLLTSVGCGKPELKETRREHYVIDEITRGSDSVVVTMHTPAGATDKTRMTVPNRAPDVTECLARLAIGATVEDVTYVYRYKPISIGGGSLPKETFGGCAIGTIPGVSQQALGPR